MMWPFKKKGPPVGCDYVAEPQPARESAVRLTIEFTDGGTRWIQFYGHDTPTVGPFKRFYKWYFGRSQSPHYMMRWDCGQQLIKRDTIKTFRLEVVDG